MWTGFSSVDPVPSPKSHVHETICVQKSEKLESMNRKVKPSRSKKNDAKGGGDAVGSTVSVSAAVAVVPSSPVPVTVRL